MKKIFMIPLLAILMAIPMIAGAVPVAGEPVAGNADSPTATSAPKYALKGAESSDENAALVSYVKGAYNALVKGINKTQEEIDTLNTGIGTYADSVNHLLDNTATQTGTVATIKNATMTEQISSSSVNIGNVTTTSISATASGDVNLSVPIMNDWATDSLAENPVEMTTSFSNLAVNNLTMSAPKLTRATLTKSGINGNVNVACKIVGNATGSSTQAGTPTPTNPVPIINYQQGGLVLRGVGEYKDTYDATTGTITRNVGVKVLDGTENWAQLSTSSKVFTTLLSDSRPWMANSVAISSHFNCRFGTPFTPYNTIELILHNSVARVYIDYPLYDGNLAGFKQYLADQYNAGTPVTVVYPLATPTTEHFVEPYTDGTTCP